MPLDDLTFLTSAPTLAALPEDAGREVVFAGRSNAGKSSAINAVFNRRGLARVSKQPGRTQAFNVFEIDPHRRVVDLPGYGYAKVPEAIQRRWAAELPRYFAEREALAGIVLIMDVRHPFKETDTAFLELARPETPVLVVLTKCDKLSRGQAGRQFSVAVKAGEPFGIGREDLLRFSATTREGVPGVRARLSAWLDLNDGDVAAREAVPAQ